MTAHLPEIPPLLGDWWKDAKCAGQPIAMFYPEGKADMQRKKQFCVGCLVREECLEYALANNICFGCWGGTSNRQRVRIKRQRREAVEPPPPNRTILDNVNHGTVRAYQKGCRCLICRAWKRRDNRITHQRRKTVAA